MKLFTISALISSSLIYNVMHSIDERALESLSFISNLANNLLAKEKNLSKYFPTLYWLIRDFALDLKGSQNQDVM
jgi:hypothetical protein